MGEPRCQLVVAVLAVLVVEEAGSHRRTDLVGQTAWVHSEAGSLSERSYSRVVRTVHVVQRLPAQAG